MWAIYSPEDYPKRGEDGWEDYRMAHGIQVILKAHTWTELKGQDGEGMGWRMTYFGNYVDGAGEGKEIFVSCREVAQRIAGDFRMRGVSCANLDKISDRDKRIIEETSEKQNLVFRKMFVDRFEIGFRMAAQGKPGRLVPNAYEQECYQILGMTPPEIVQRVQQPSTDKQIVVEPDPAMIAQLVAQEVTRQMEVKTAPAKG